MKRALCCFQTFIFLFLVHSVCAHYLCSARYRLPGNVKPTFYSIKIHPFLENNTFSGEVSIHIQIDYATEVIELHAKNLNITSFYFDGEVVLKPKDCNCKSDDFKLIFFSDDIIRIYRSSRKLIPSGRHILQIKYRGCTSDTESGLFKIANRTYGILATDFEPTNARTVFPCFDEPAFKSKYQLNVVVPNGSYIALSNTEVEATDRIPGGILYRFKTTPIMSIYLLSFVITQNGYSEFISKNNVTVRAYYPNANKSDDNKLLQFASNVIDFCADYTNFPYVLSKIDFVEYPRIESTATENWGLVTFNVSLLSPKSNLYDDSQKMAVMAHELSHFWVGNLVTNAWWDDIWLQESFATFMGIKAEEQILDNKAVINFPETYTENLLSMESEHKTNPIVKFLENPKEIRKHFNDVTYNKGASLLRMIELLIGENTMQNILRDYIKKFAFKTASTDDFLTILSTHYQSVYLREFMETYLYQNHFPFIYVEENENDYILSQRYLNGKKDENSPFNHKWTIPITYITDLNENYSTIWFPKDVEDVRLPKDNTSWIKLNYRAVGYYRVHYNPNLWEMLGNHHQELEEYERNHLLLEAINLFYSNLSSCDVVLKFVWEMSKSENIRPISAFYVYYKLEEAVITDEQAVDNLHTFLLKAVENVGKNIHLTPSKVEGKKISNLEDSKKACIEWLNNESYKYYDNQIN